MSREELGDAPDDFATLPLLEQPSAAPIPAAPIPAATPAAATPAEPIPAAPTAEPMRSEPIPAAPAPAPKPIPTPARRGHTLLLGPLRRHRGRIAAAAAMLLTSGLVGWLGGDAWQNGQDRSAPDPGLVASAVALDVRPSGGTRVRTAADVVVQITNLSTGTLTLAGAEATFDAGAITGMTPSQLEIPSGRSAVTTVDAAVACGSPQPLRLPAIQVRIDHRLRSVPVDGSAAALGEVCNQLPDDVHLLTLESVGRDGDRLLVVVHSPTGRTTQIEAISARGVPITGRGFPTTVVDAMEHTFWLDRPTTCPSEWVRSGLPRTLDLRLDTGGESGVSLDLGFSLTRWLREGPCHGAGR